MVDKKRNKQHNTLIWKINVIERDLLFFNFLLFYLSYNKKQR
jgi:hypothetical protein